MQDAHSAYPSAPGDDESRLAFLLCQHLPTLQAFIRRRCGAGLRAKESVSDLAQSVCREVLDDLGRRGSPDGDELLGWLLKRASRKLMDRARYYARQMRDVAREASPDAAGGAAQTAGRLAELYLTHCTPSRLAMGREQLRCFERARQRLPGQQGEAVLLTKVIHLSTSDVAEILDVSDGAVRALVARGLATIAVRMREEGT